MKHSTARDNPIASRQTESVNEFRNVPYEEVIRSLLQSHHLGRNIVNVTLIGRQRDMGQLSSVRVGLFSFPATFPAPFLLLLMRGELSPSFLVGSDRRANVMAHMIQSLGGAHNPSTWSRRLPVILFSLLGYLIAMYLAFYQAGLLSSVWEPFFGSGSRMILKDSVIARYCPVPDASLGAFLYLLDVLLNCLGGEDRWRTAPWTVLAVGLVSGSLAVGGVLLAISQPLFFHHYCTLCLASTCCSLGAAAFATDEVRMAIQGRRLGRNQST